MNIYIDEHVYRWTSIYMNIYIDEHLYIWTYIYSCSYIDDHLNIYICSYIFRCSSIYIYVHHRVGNPRIDKSPRVLIYLFGWFIYSERLVKVAAPLWHENQGPFNFRARKTILWIRPGFCVWLACRGEVGATEQRGGSAPPHPPLQLRCQLLLNHDMAFVMGWW